MLHGVAVGLPGGDKKIVFWRGVAWDPPLPTTALVPAFMILDSTAPVFFLWPWTPNDRPLFISSDIILLKLPVFRFIDIPSTYGLVNDEIVYSIIFLLLFCTNNK